MQFNPYVTFNGTCAEAFTVYERVFGGKITAMVTHRDVPASVGLPPDWQDKILHACLEVNGRQLMGSDRPLGGFREAAGISVQIEIDTSEEADRIFAALSEGGTVGMPIGETFWARRFGAVTDRFGIPFMINCAKSF